MSWITSIDPIGAIKMAWNKEFVATITSIDDELIPAHTFEALDDELKGIPGAIESTLNPDEHYQITGDWRELDERRFRSLVLTAIGRVASQTGDKFEVVFSERFTVSE